MPANIALIREAAASPTIAAVVVGVAIIGRALGPAQQLADAVRAAAKQKKVLAVAEHACSTIEAGELLVLLAAPRALLGRYYQSVPLGSYAIDDLRALRAAAVNRPAALHALNNRAGDCLSAAQAIVCGLIDAAPTIMGPLDIPAQLAQMPAVTPAAPVPAHRAAITPAPAAAPAAPAAPRPAAAASHTPPPAPPAVDAREAALNDARASARRITQAARESGAIR